jgi:hypothetical protein
MQYILSEEEMAVFSALKERRRSLPDLATLQEMCTKIADEWATWKGWDNEHDPEPWGCVITAEEEGDEHYCDNCPVQDICPREYKSWSK